MPGFVCGPRARARRGFPWGALAAVVLTALAPTGCQEAPSDPPLSVEVAPPDGLAATVAEVRGRLRPFAASGAAVSLAVVGPEGAIWSEAHGWADADRTRPATAGTRFRVYSVAKPMTAVAAARLMERGELDPALPVQAYVPSFPEKEGPITAMDLAIHTSGIRHYADEAEARSTLHCDAVADALAIFAGDPLVHAPGARETYSSWGYVLLSAVIEAAEGRPFPEAMAGLVFRPAGMTGTALDDPGRSDDRRADFHRERADGTLVPEAEVDNTCKWGAGGFVSTAGDVARFGRAMIDGSLIGPATLELFLQGRSTYSAQGVGPGGTAFLIADAGHGLAIALLANATGERLGPELQSAVRDLHEALTGSGGGPPGASARANGTGPAGR